jgi:excisionase family DNA binding protein
LEFLAFAISATVLHRGKPVRAKTEQSKLPSEPHDLLVRSLMKSSEPNDQSTTRRCHDPLRFNGSITAIPTSDERVANQAYIGGRSPTLNPNGLPTVHPMVSHHLVIITGRTMVDPSGIVCIPTSPIRRRPMSGPAPTAQNRERRRYPETPAILLTPEEAADALHIGRSYMYALLASGAIESVKVGRLRRIVRMPSVLEVRPVGPNSWVVFHRSLSIQVAWPIWATRRQAERFRRGLDGLGDWDRDAASLRADAALWQRVRELIADLEAGREARRHRDYRMPQPTEQLMSALSGGDTGRDKPAQSKKEQRMTEIEPTGDGFLTDAEAQARDGMEILRGTLAERARTAVNTSYEELLDQAVTADGEDLVEKAALIGTDLIVTGWRWHEGIGTEGYVSVSAVVGETRSDPRTARVRDENSAGPPPEPGSHICFNDSGQGCARRLRVIEARALRAGEEIPPLHFPRGLRVSKYQAGPQGAVRRGEAAPGGTKEASTYYFA